MESIAPYNSKRGSLPYIGQFIERFNFWGLQSILVLYLIATTALPKSSTYIVYGLFTGCAFIMAYFGGIISDKLVGSRIAVIIAIGLECLGNFLLFMGYSSFIYINLSVIAIGAGLFLANNPQLVASKQHVSDLKKWNNMSLLYVAENMGFILGLLFYGFISNYLGIKFCFLLSTCLLGTYLGILIYDLKFLTGLSSHNNPIAVKHLLITAITIFTLILVVDITLSFSKFSNHIMVILGGITIISFLITIYRSKINQKNIIFTLLAIFPICLIFFTVLFQMNSSIQMFVHDYVNRKIFYWHIPASSFAASESVFTILWAPLFSLIWYYFYKNQIIISNISKVALGLLFQSIGFFIFIQAIQLALKTIFGISPFLMLPGYLFLGAGDICLMVTVLTTLTTLAPYNLRGTIMGSFYVLIGWAGFLAGNLAELTVPTSNTDNPLLLSITVYKNMNHFAFFISLSILSICLLLQRRTVAIDTI